MSPSLLLSHIHQMAVSLGAEVHRAATHLVWDLLSFSSDLRWHRQVEALL